MPDTMPDAGGHRILVVEDEVPLAASIAEIVGRAGYAADTAHDGDEALAKATQSRYDLILLDLNLPHVSGLDVLRELRSRSYTTPVLILSARRTVDDRVEGLRSGADDFLVKPFDPTELVARIEAILRRSDPSAAPILQAADLTMNLFARTVRRDREDVHLSPREFSLLEYFLRNRGQVLTRRRIAEQVWGHTFDTGTNVVDVYVSYLRKAIDKGRDTPLIETVHGQGFRFRDA